MYRMNGPETKYIYMQTLTANNGPRANHSCNNFKSSAILLKDLKKKNPKNAKNVYFDHEP